MSCIFCSGLKISEAWTCFLPWYSSVFICFSNVLPKGEYINLTSSIILLWSDDNISSPVRCSYLSALPEDNADIFATSMLISNYILSSLILS